MSNINQNDYSASYHIPMPTNVYTVRKQSNQQTTRTSEENSSIKSEKRSCLEKIKLGFYISILVFLILLVVFMLVCFVVMLFGDERPWRRNLFHIGHSSAGSAMSTGDSSSD